LNQKAELAPFGFPGSRQFGDTVRHHHRRDKAWFGDTRDGDGGPRHDGDQQIARWVEPRTVIAAVTGG
jgi:hypothetical protein